ncbi:MAG: CPBP family intramembrane metalloprotease [Anaerolineales bacterium]|nr:CPBP family intramembrane metalloprotease [Anaerolineales bacterium]
MSTKKSLLQRYSILIFVFLVIELAPRIGSFLANRFQSRLSFLDPDQVFSWGIIHHLAQFLIVLLIMIVWPRKPLREWGFRRGNLHKGIRWIGWFSVVWIGFYTVLTVINIRQHNQLVTYYDVTDMRNLWGELIFRGLLVGISEETLFRSFPITLLSVYWYKEMELFRTRSMQVRLSQAGIISVVLFVYAHIAFNYYPFEIIAFNVVQLITAAGLGILYVIVFDDTKSIYYPAIIHSISDVIPVLSLVILSLVNK